MKRTIKITAVLAVILIVPGGTFLVVAGASCGIGGLDTMRDDALKIKDSIFALMSRTLKLYSSPSSSVVSKS